MPYDIKALRTVKHGLEEVNSYCRMCNYGEQGKQEVVRKARYHAQTTLHTVDIYRENWTEITSHVKKL